MRKMRLLCVAAALPVAMIFTAAPEAQGCVTCTVSQDCLRGGNATSCDVWTDLTGQWCNMQGYCNGLALNSLDVSPAGTFVAEETVVAADSESLVAPCNDFIVASLDADEERADATAIHI